MFNRIMMIVALGFIFLLSSCSSFHSINLKKPLNDSIRPNDKVLITTKFNQVDSLTVSEITSTELKGANVSIEINSLKELKKRELSPWKNALITGIVAGSALTPGFGIIVFTGSYTVIKLMNNPPIIESTVAEWH